VQQQTWLLWSINERLNGKQGVDLPEPNFNWLDDVIHLAIIEAEEEENGKDNETATDGGGYQRPQLLSD